MNDEFGLNALAAHHDAYMAELDAADEADRMAAVIASQAYAPLADFIYRTYTVGGAYYSAQNIDSHC